MIHLPLEPWKLDAACADRGIGHLFFAPDGERNMARLSREAKARAVCAGCEVRGPCLESALAERMTYGFWSGTNEEDRVVIRRRRAMKGNERISTSVSDTR